MPCEASKRLCCAKWYKETLCRNKVKMAPEIDVDNLNVSDKKRARHSVAANMRRKKCERLGLGEKH